MPTTSITLTRKPASRALHANAPATTHPSASTLPSSDKTRSTETDALPIIQDQPNLSCETSDLSQPAHLAPNSDKGRAAARSEKQADNYWSVNDPELQTAWEKLQKKQAEEAKAAEELKKTWPQQLQAKYAEQAKAAEEAKKDVKTDIASPTPSPELASPAQTPAAATPADHGLSTPREPSAVDGPELNDDFFSVDAPAELLTMQKNKSGEEELVFISKGDGSLIGYTPPPPMLLPKSTSNSPAEKVSPAKTPTPSSSALPPASPAKDKRSKALVKSRSEHTRATPTRPTSMLKTVTGFFAKPLIK